jgi:hypothetical protein
VIVIPTVVTGAAAVVSIATANTIIIIIAHNVARTAGMPATPVFIADQPNLFDVGQVRTTGADIERCSNGCG